ncbi:hypothetical protein CC1G_00757 [Coprinopsis cinerea okayama7|uniref:Uncharacterized protein n=1 Tax=Coprinopsis cinerea (strain Okayama-7 / 130 / ATCC MYA-4618 / FGSC 9003) TaxID=240176 RepID=A8N9E3_COPC7|nr:hypothetical protein CC1G_00757 [Coprinopsis cinerea okayama7\|eukprot:XP_001831210.2 hypothetical protein CC1G_00757 [Coprinopsis cinerea okayama7\
MSIKSQFRCLVAISFARTVSGTYNIAPINPASIPMHLRPFVTPCIRRVYLDTPSSEAGPSTSPSSSSSSTSDSSGELARLRAENQTLRTHCVLWRRRAELHGAATLGLLDFARMVRDQAVSLAQERDNLRKECTSLKRKLDKSVDHSPPPQSGPSESPSIPPFTFCYPFQRDLPPCGSTSSVNQHSTVENSRLAASNLFELESTMYQKPSLPSTRPGSYLRNLPEHNLPSSSNSASTSSGARSGVEPPAKRMRHANTSSIGYPSVQIRSSGVPVSYTYSSPASASTSRR